MSFFASCIGFSVGVREERNTSQRRMSALRRKPNQCQCPQLAECTSSKCSELSELSDYSVKRKLTHNKKNVTDSC